MLNPERARKKYGAAARHYLQWRGKRCNDPDCEIHHRGEKKCFCRMCRRRSK